MFPLLFYCTASSSSRRHWSFSKSYRRTEEKVLLSHFILSLASLFSLPVFLFPSRSFASFRCYMSLTEETWRPCGKNGVRIYGIACSARERFVPLDLLSRSRRRRERRRENEREMVFKKRIAVSKKRGRTLFTRGYVPFLLGCMRNESGRISVDIDVDVDDDDDDDDDNVDDDTEGNVSKR